MFTAEDLKTRLRVRPFTPVRIITSAGEKYDVFHPDLVWVGAGELFVGTASDANPTVFDRYSVLSILHVTALENLPTPAAPQPPEQNGQ